MQDKNIKFPLFIGFETTWKRIKTETGIKSMEQLGEIIGKKQTTISSAKKRGEFPPEWAWKVGQKYGILTEWILTGRGPKRITEAKGFFATIEEWAKETGNGNTIWFKAQFRTMFPAFAAWEKEKKAETDQNQMSA